MKKIAIVLLVALLTCALCVPALAEADKPFAGTQLKVYNWYDYIDEEVLDIFEEETGIHVNYVNFSQNEDMYTKLSTGAEVYDVIFPSEYMIERLIKEDLLAELNLDNIPNMANVLDNLLDPIYDPGNAHSVPYMWGTLGIVVNTDMVPEPITSWEALLDENYAGNIFMMDSMRDTIGLALKVQGYSMNTHDEDELAAAGDWLMAQKDSGVLAGYILDQAKDMMANNEAAMAVMYSGDALYAMEKNDALDYVIPDEGSNIWVDGMCIPKVSENKEAAECFINFMCRPDIAQMNMDEIYYSSPIKQVVENLSEEELASTAMNPTDEMLARCEYYVDISDVAYLYDDIWMDVLM
ncbi:MAG: spermidine/putrescine ABC transporter substrate-binding protein [Clostridia bacterium]|nr:spermidine/putrescine ABC transporter substrate-binding protein [Clostridia bacterium]